MSFTWEGETHEIAHMHRGEGFFDFEHKIPPYVAANGPRLTTSAPSGARTRVQ